MKRIRLLPFFAKRLALVFLFGMLGGSVFSQVDSVNIQFETGTNPYDSNDTVDVMKITVSGYDSDGMGSMLTMVYDVGSGNLVALIENTTTQLITQSLLSGNVATVRVYDIDPSLDYRIEVLVKNDQGGNYPLITTNYEAE